MQRTDYLERMIQEVARAVAQALRIARSGDAERAAEDLRATWSAFIGLRREDLLRVDAATARALLGERRDFAVQILEAQSGLGDAAATRLLSALR